MRNKINSLIVVVVVWVWFLSVIWRIFWGTLHWVEREIDFELGSKKWRLWFQHLRERARERNGIREIEEVTQVKECNANCKNEEKCNTSVSYAFRKFYYTSFSSPTNQTFKTLLFFFWSWKRCVFVFFFLC